MRIFSTAAGNCVAVDSFKSDPSNEPTELDWKILSKESDNWKLLEHESGICEPKEETQLHIQSYKKWLNTGKVKNSSDSGSNSKTATDSARHTGDGTSSSSYEATETLNWVKLKDTSTGSDSGLSSGDNFQTLEPVTLSGPHNVFKCDLESRGTFQKKTLRS